MESHEMLKALKSANRVTEFHHVHVVQYALENILIYTIQYAEIIMRQFNIWQGSYHKIT